MVDFPADVDRDDESFVAVDERFEALATRPSVDIHVLVLRTEAPLDSDVFPRVQRAARVEIEFGITQQVVVSEDIENRALRSESGEVPGGDIDRV